MVAGVNGNGNITRPHASVSVKDVGLDSFHFAKFCKDSNLMDGIMKLQPQDVDLIFVKAKAYKCKGADARAVAEARKVRKLTFPAFKEAIKLLAFRCNNMNVNQFISYLTYATASGPSMSGTFAEGNRFYDDPQTYTGVHKHGGPTIIDAEKQTLAMMVNRNVDRTNTLRAKKEDWEKRRKRAT
jgi:hypothetical protein